MKLGISLGRAAINDAAFMACAEAKIDGLEISLGTKNDADGFDFAFA